MTRFRRTCGTAAALDPSTPDALITGVPVGARPTARTAAAVVVRVESQLTTVGGVGLGPATRIPPPVEVDRPAREVVT